MLDLAGELRDAEVDELDELGIAAAADEHDVAGAHVAMHDAVGVGGGERVAQLRGDARGARRRQARLCGRGCAAESSPARYSIT